MIATAGGPEKCLVSASWARTTRSTTNSEDMVAARQGAAPEGRGADVILDPVGGDVFDASRKFVAFEGRIP